MAARWEYLTVQWIWQKTNPDNPGDESAEWTSKYTINVRRPGSSEPEVVSTETHIWRNGMTEWELAEKQSTDIFTLNNELGAEGWECYSVVTMQSAVVQRPGFEAASYPLDMRHYFKRPVA